MLRVPLGLVLNQSQRGARMACASSSQKASARRGSQTVAPVDRAFTLSLCDVDRARLASNATLNFRRLQMGELYKQNGQQLYSTDFVPEDNTGLENKILKNQ